MVAVVIFDDSEDGNVYIMGKDKHSAVECVMKGIESRKYHYVHDTNQRRQYLEQTVKIMSGEN